MKHVMVRYQVKPDEVAANERLIAAVFEELARVRPAGLHYASYRLADGVGFVHVATIDPAAGDNPLLALASFRAFTRDIAARCDVPPGSTELAAIGAYP